jgi:DNA-binding NtrC family response regulator
MAEPPVREPGTASADDTERHDDSARPGSPGGHSHAWLRVFADGGTASFRIEASGTTIGRKARTLQADILFDDGRMSRAHARIFFETPCWMLEDLGSRNGGFVDGAPFATRGRAALMNGSVVRIGRTVAVFATRQAPVDGGDTEFFPGISAAASDIRARVRRLAASSGHVLILGETGTGKERVARRLASDGVFVPQNCAGLRPDLAHAELFGHIRGAFTGATAAREGLVDAARDGVLFLDEVGELALDVQAELLRFLEDGQYRPVGPTGSTELRVSRARVVAATNRDLDEAVRAGTFRRDLLARLRASNRPLELPRLRDRREDVPIWADRFLREAQPESPPWPWSAGALECLLLYPWPDNLRELRGVIRGAVEAPAVWPLGSAQLPERLQAHRLAHREVTPDSRPAPMDIEPTPNQSEPRDAPTREQIMATLLQTGGKMRATAELLGINRRRLYRLCDRLGIDPDPFRRGE